MDRPTKPPLNATSCRLTINIRQIDFKTRVFIHRISTSFNAAVTWVSQSFERVVRLVCGASERIFGAGAVEFQKIH